jgi:hypothetical protein
MILPVTLATAAAIALLNVWLAIRIVRIRFATKTVNGTGGNAVLEGRMRAQANLVEYAPYVLIMLAGIELAGGSPTWLWIASVAFVAVRLSHAIGMGMTGPTPWRVIGFVGTIVLTLLLAGWAIATVYSARLPGATIVVAPVSANA